MPASLIFDYIHKKISNRIHLNARKAEQELSPHNFTAYYPFSFCASMFFLSIFLMIIALVLTHFSIFTERWFGIIFFVISIIALVLSLHLLLYRCHVDSYGLTVVYFFIFKKNVLWKDVKRLEIRTYRPFNRPVEKYIILRGRNNKRLLDFSYDLVGFHLIIKMAKDYRTKKNLYS